MSEKYALWAPEMASKGGIQSYMWRIWEVLCRLSSEDGGRKPTGVSLMDTEGAIHSYPAPLVQQLKACSSSKYKFVGKCLGLEFKDSFVIVGHAYQAPVAWLAKKLGRIKGYIVVLHGIEAWERMTWLRRHALMSADINVTTTFYTAEKCSEMNDISMEKFSVIPLCVENTVGFDSKFELEGEYPILFVGRLDSNERYKGLDTLLFALAELIKQNIKINLHVIGDGNDRQRMEVLADSLELSSESVIFHGRVSDEVLQAAYSQAKIFAMPSKGEGFGIVFLEAMRYGVPCIGGRHGGTPEVVSDGETGYLVEHGDVNALANYIKITKEERKSLFCSEKIKSIFMKNYMFENFYEGWTKVIGGHSVRKASD